MKDMIDTEILEREWKLATMKWERAPLALFMGAARKKKEEDRQIIKRTVQRTTALQMEGGREGGSGMGWVLREIEGGREDGTDG
jgi:hypothetical protein